MICSCLKVGVLKMKTIALEKEKADFVYKFRDVDKFLTVGSEMAIQTFIDHIISAVYVIAGSEGTNANTGELVEWLWSAEANVFFQCGHSMVVSDTEVTLDGAFLTLLRSLRAIATHISCKFAHTTKSVQF